MIRIGTSGWSYPHWRGRFYPIGVSARNELAYASSQFDTLEINRSFYSLLRPSTCELWRQTTPARFLFALKGGNFITHSKKLRGVETALANYFASGPLVLGAKLGPIVWQLPASLRFDRSRLDEFFALLPRTGAAAAQLAERHDERVPQPGVSRVSSRQRIRHAIEPRHESFRDPEFSKLARKHKVAIAVADSADWPCIEEVTTDFMYVRLHGGERTYASGYDARAIRSWRDRIAAWQERRVRNVYVYFDNDGEAHAPEDARALLSAVARG